MQHIAFHLKIEDNVISRVSSIKFLGVIKNETLTWKDHITTTLTIWLQLTDKLAQKSCQIGTFGR